MPKSVLLLTPPFTQLNTPYPAIMQLTGFLKSRGICCSQADLGIEVILTLFSEQGFRSIFDELDETKMKSSRNSRSIRNLSEIYIRTIDPVIRFLQGKDPSLAYRIVERDFLPEASRFKEVDDLEWAFGTMGLQDKAKHLATLYLEDMSDLITECIDPHFGFSRYAEQLGRSANTFDALHQELQQPNTLIDNLLLHILEEKIQSVKPGLIGFSVPFPGNLFTALRCGQWLKKHHPEIKIVMGGGFAGTELRSLSDPRVFEYFDYIILDDGEAPLLQLIRYLDGEIPVTELKRTFLCQDNEVHYYNGVSIPDFSPSESGIPVYTGLPLDKYISVIEIINPMHRLWSDGRWNKLTLAHGCYWAKCSFCDTSLDYIKRYEPNSVADICNRIEDIILQTGHSGFHFTDEAAPPALLRALAEEILRRQLTITWWTNIRFEKSFTSELCNLLKQSGCIAVSGGLEVASERILKLINKGVSIEQVANVTANFTENGIMVHAYLMYGFPTQTAQETIDSLEVVRQLFEQGLIQSGFWHRFALTAHSEIGQNPTKFSIRNIPSESGSFANNDLTFSDPTGCDHEAFGKGLRVSLFNYMQGSGFELPLHHWFDFKITSTKISPKYIENILKTQ